MANHLDLTSSQCETQYNLRRAHPDFQHILADWQVQSAQTRRDLAVAPNLQYGPSENETLDLFSAKNKHAPLLLFIHGGYWQSGDKRDVSFVARYLVEAGITVCVSNYGLAPGTTLATMVEQTRRTLGWLHANAARFNFDHRRIYLMGHSAGAHLAAMMLTRHGLQTASPDPQAAGARNAPNQNPDHPGNHENGKPAVQGVIAISGLFDLAPLLQTSINQALQLKPGEAARLSPVHLYKELSSPLYTLVGARETEAFKTQELAIAAHWNQVYPLPHVPDKHHYTVLDIFMDPANPWLREIAARITKSKIGFPASR